MNKIQQAQLFKNISQFSLTTLDMHTHIYIYI